MISNLKEDINDLKHDIESMSPQFITKAHFEAVTEPIQDTIKEMQRDIKRILMIVSRNESTRPNIERSTT